MQNQSKKKDASNFACIDQEQKSSPTVSDVREHKTASDIFDKALEVQEISLGDPQYILWKDNDRFNTIDEQIAGLTAKSEEAYIQIANDILEASTNQLKKQNASKNELKESLVWFFKRFILLQYWLLIVLMLVRIVIPTYLSDNVLITYITSVFAETLGAIILMVKYAFNSDQEVQILRILNDVIANFQKFGNDKDRDTK